MREEDIGTFEMLWDCPRCGTAKLLGVTHRFCPGCGGAQDPTLRYFPSDEAKVAVKDHAFTGADIQCAHCQTPNSAAASHCVNCGSGLADAGAVALRNQREVAEGVRDEGETGDQARAEAAAKLAAEHAIMALVGSKGPPKKSKKGLWIFLTVLALVGAAIFVFFIWKKTVTVEVMGHSWAQSIAVERFQTDERSEWCSDMPRGARNVRQKREKKGTKKVEDGETCKTKKVDRGDGTFKEVRECKPKYREEPVYAKKCYFEVDAWMVVRTPEAKGTNLEPVWPSFQLAKEGDCLGCEREGKRKGTYTVHLRGQAAEDTYDCEYPLERWKGLPVGTKMKGESGMVTDSLDCEDLKPQ